ncbi:hypothetical protein T484DRAFT_1940330 [Baffinella frigidus]|nr:hypothetical protein T484DRAFT_1940330 [Cryptophyta sp. CCMP2293]
MPGQQKWIPGSATGRNPSLPEGACGRLFLCTDGDLHPAPSFQKGKQPHGGFARRRPVNVILMTRYKWRMACASARLTDTPEEAFLAVMQLRGCPAPSRAQYDSIHSTSSSPSSINSLRVCSKSAPRPRPASVDAASSPVFDVSPADAASRPRSWDYKSLPCASRAERDPFLPPTRYSLPALSPRIGILASTQVTRVWPSPLDVSRLPGALRCARAHASPQARCDVPAMGREWFSRNPEPDCKTG